MSDWKFEKTEEIDENRPFLIFDKLEAYGAAPAHSTIKTKNQLKSLINKKVVLKNDYSMGGKVRGEEFWLWELIEHRKKDVRYY